MESGGPYKHSRMRGACTPYCNACIYAEGRKSMEKELEELYKIASELCIERNNLYGFETDGILDFAAYKKLRGIE